MGLEDNIGSLYEAVASQFDRDRSKDLMEQRYLHKVLQDKVPQDKVHQDSRQGWSVLDLGCGSGEPIAKYFIEAGCKVTGVDISPTMIAMCRERFPKENWIEADMRKLTLQTSFDALIAWDSFFHLCPADQRQMFGVFAGHVKAGGKLIFTSGPKAGVAIGEIYGHKLYHASLDAGEYEALLRVHGFDVLEHCVEDKTCGNHTVWVAIKER